MTILQNILLVIEGFLSLALVVIVMSQNSKNEGLTGNIGVQAPANFKGKPGYEERMQGYTRTIGIAWFALNLVIGIVSARIHG